MSAATTPGLPSDQQRLGTAIMQLVEKARREADDERRTDVRYPFFRTIDLSIDNGKTWSSGFSREVSRGGMGLLHFRDLEPETELWLRVVCEGKTRCFLSRVVWTRPCGEGWHISGVKFLDLA